MSAHCSCGVPSRSIPHTSPVALGNPVETPSRAAEETYELAEDFFFRTVHLGTECWALIAHNRLQCAARFAAKGHWHNASARLCQVHVGRGSRCWSQQPAQPQDKAIELVVRPTMPTVSCCRCGKLQS